MLETKFHSYIVSVLKLSYVVFFRCEVLYSLVDDVTMLKGLFALVGSRVLILYVFVFCCNEGPLIVVAYT